MWICEKCGHENTNHVNYCEYCDHVPTTLKMTETINGGYEVETIIENNKRRYKYVETATFVLRLSIFGSIIMMCVSLWLENEVSGQLVDGSILTASFMSIIYSYLLRCCLIYGFIKVLELLERIATRR